MALGKGQQIKLDRETGTVGLKASEMHRITMAPDSRLKRMVGLEASGMIRTSVAGDSTYMGDSWS